MRVHHCGLVAALILALGLSIAACGSDDDDESGARTSTAGGQQGSGPVDDARATIEKFLAEQPPIELPALSKKPPADIHFALMGCPLPVCKIQTDGATAGAKALGWKVTLFTSPLTPEGYLQTWQRVLDAKPDVIAYTGLLPREATEKQLAAADAADIPTVVYAPNGYGPADSGAPRAAYSGDPQFKTDGDLMGAMVVADAGEGAQAVSVSDPTFAYLTTTEQAFVERVEAAGGSVDQLKVAVAGIGKAVPSAIVSYLQSHPDVEYVALTLNDLSVGLPAALMGAGLADKVKVIARAPSPANMSEIASGDQWAAVAEENTSSGWRVTDGLARLVIGDDISSCCRAPDGWHQIFTKDNATPNVAPQTPGVPDSFLEAWQVEG